MNIARQFQVDATGPSFTLCYNGVIYVRIANKLLIYDLKSLEPLKCVETIDFYFGVLFSLQNQLIEISNDVYSYDAATFARTTVQRLKSELQTYFSCDDQIFVVYDNKLHIYQISSNYFDFILHIPYAFARGITTRRGDVLVISQLQMNGLVLPYSILIDLADNSVVPVPPVTAGINGDVVHYGKAYATVGSAADALSESSLVKADCEVQLSVQNSLTRCAGTVEKGLLYVADVSGAVYEISGDFVDQERTQLLIVKNASIAQNVEYLENRNSREKLLIARVQELMSRLERCRENTVRDVYPALKTRPERLAEQAENSVYNLLKELAERDAEILSLKAQLKRATQ